MLLTLSFLLVSLAAYTLFGGADFGGGILEATLHKHPRLQKKIEDTLAPVWEANHVWLIAVVVILFVGFPIAYAELSTLLFVPFSLALMGIVFRGAFFTFRKYDPDPAPRRPLYSALFRISSAVTPMMFGFIAAAMLAPFPVIPESGAVAFAEVFIRPWATVLGLLCGIFVVLLFGYVASVFLFGELDNDEDRAPIRVRIIGFFLATFAAGGLVLSYGAFSNIIVVGDALNPVQIAAQSVAFLGIPILWFALKQERITIMRLVAGAQVLCVLIGWFSTQFPVFLSYADGRQLTVYDGGAPDVTHLWLNIGLACVLSVVVPLLVYLYRVFGRPADESPFSNQS